MIKTALKWGIALSIALSVWTIVIHLLGFYTTHIAAGKRADIAVMILPILAIGLAQYERRKAGAGYRHLVGTGILVGIFSLPIFMAFMWIYHHNVNPGWVDHLVAYERTSQAAAGATQAHVDSAVAAIRATGTDAAQISGSIVAIILSIVLSLVIGGAVIVASKQRIPPPDAA